jgi:lysophospholipase L1-like esterase
MNWLKPGKIFSTTFASRQITQRMNSEPTHHTPALFLGDSLTEGFDLQRHFQRKDLVNHGISGNLTDHVIYRMEAAVKLAPRKLFLMIGINDILSGRTIDEVYRNTLTILDYILEHAKHTKIMVQSVLPVRISLLFEDGGINTDIYRLNHMLEKKCGTDDRLTYVDLHTEFLDAHGEMNMKFTFDGLHLNESGYGHWRDLIRELL